MDNTKLKYDTVYNIEGEYDPDNLFLYMSDICAILKIPVPVILNKHLRTLKEHGMAKFLPDEFVESFPYDKLLIEIFDDKDDKKK